MNTNKFFLSHLLLLSIIQCTNEQQPEFALSTAQVLSASYDEVTEEVVLSLSFYGCSKNNPKPLCINSHPIKCFWPVKSGTVCSDKVIRQQQLRFPVDPDSDKDDSISKFSGNIQSTYYDSNSNELVLKVFVESCDQDQYVNDELLSCTSAIPPSCSWHIKIDDQSCDNPKEITQKVTLKIENFEDSIRIGEIDINLSEKFPLEEEARLQ